MMTWQVKAVKNEESSQISRLNEEIRMLKEKLMADGGVGRGGGTGTSVSAYTRCASRSTTFLPIIVYGRGFRVALNMFYLTLPQPSHYVELGHLLSNFLISAPIDFYSCFVLLPAMAMEIQTHF